MQVGPKQLQVPRGIVAERPAAEPRKPCPDILPPIPPVAHITIEPGKPVDADAGGEALLRAYIAQREWTLKNR